MKVDYKNGPTFDNSYFLLDDGKEKIKVKASQVIPLPVQMKIKAGDESVVSPEEAIEQISNDYSSVEEFKGYAKEVTAKNKITARKLKAEKSEEPKDSKKSEKSKDSKKTAKKVNAANYEDWSVDQSEIPSDVNKKQKVELAVDEKEVAADKGKVKTVSNPAVKKYYGRLPSRSVGTDPEMAIDRKSSLSKKIKAQQKEIEKLKEQLKNKDQEVSKEKQKQARKEKAEKLDKVLEILSSQNKIDIENEKEREETISKFADMETKSLDLAIEMLEKNDSNIESKKTERKASKNIPGTFASKNVKRKNDVETMSDLWANSTKPVK